MALGETLRNIRSEDNPTLRRQKRLELLKNPYGEVSEVHLAQTRVLELLFAIREDVLPDEENIIRHNYEDLLNAILEGIKREEESPAAIIQQQDFQTVRDVFLDIFALCLEEPTPTGVELIKQARWPEDTVRPGDVTSLILRFGLAQPQQLSLGDIGKTMGGFTRENARHNVNSGLKILRHPKNLERLRPFLPNGF